jgi:hypothetical protein
MEVLTPVKGFTNVLQSADRPTISLVLPGLLTLLDKFEFAGKVYEEAMSQVLKRRFDLVINSGEGTKEPIYLVAAFLDPKTMRLDIIRTKKKKAKELMKGLARKFYPEAAQGVLIDAEIDEPSPFGFGTVRVKQPTHSAIDVQVQKFFDEIDGSEKIENDALFFWGSRRKVTKNVLITV